MKNINRREFVRSASLVTGAIATATELMPAAHAEEASAAASGVGDQASARAGKPNILFILVDNLGYGEVGA